VHRPRPYLRDLDAADATFYRSLYGCADAMRHVGPPLSDAAARRAFEAALRQRPAHYWVVVEPQVGGGIGLVGLVPDRGAPASAEIGVLLAAGMGRRGYASGAIVAVCHRAFAAGIERIWARHAAGHLAAERLMRRMGFAPCPRETPGGEWRWQRLAVDGPPPSGPDAWFNFAEGAASAALPRMA